MNCVSGEMNIILFLTFDEKKSRTKEHQEEGSEAGNENNKTKQNTDSDKRYTFVMT